MRARGTWIAGLTLAAGCSIGFRTSTDAATSPGDVDAGGRAAASIDSGLSREAGIDSSRPADASPGFDAGALAEPCTLGYADCNGDPTDGCEVDLSSSLAHCGACEAPCVANDSSLATCAEGTCKHSCEAPNKMCGSVCADLATSLDHCGSCFSACADDCRGGACVPRVIVSGLTYPRDIGSDGQALYVSDEGRLLKYSVDGQRLLEWSAPMIDIFAIAGDYVYWVAGGKFSRVPRAGGPVETLASGAASTVYGIVPRGADVFTATSPFSGPATLHWIHGATGAVTTVGSLASGSSGVVAATTDGVYVVDVLTQELALVDPSTGARTARGQASTFLSRAPCVIDGKLIYATFDGANWSALDGGGNGVLFSRPQPSSGSSYLFCDGNDVYSGGATVGTTGSHLFEFTYPNGPATDRGQSGAVLMTAMTMVGNDLFWIMNYERAIARKKVK